MPYLELDDINLYYEIKGSGKPLILVPGLSGTCDAFSLISSTLAKKFTVVSLDNRGAGRSLPKKASFTVQAMVEDLSNLIKHLGYGKVNILGHSMGGFIVQEYVNIHSDKIDRVILSNTSTICSYRNIDIFKCLIKLLRDENCLECWHRMFSQWIYTSDFISNNPEGYESAISYSMNYPYHQKPENFEAQAEACMNYKSSIKGKIHSPVLIICGEKDILIAPEESAELQNAFPESKLIVMRGAGHIPMIENKEEYSKIILDFLSA